MLTLDPPDHSRLRGLVVKAFTARRVDDMGPLIQAIVDQAIGRVAGHGQMDLIDEFAFRLPVIVVCDMLGIPEEDHEIFFQRERSGGRLLDPVPLSRAEIDAANSAHQASTDYFNRLFERRRRQPGTDLTTQLLQAEEGGSQLSSEELIANIILLFGAGHETTINLIGNGLLALHRHPAQLYLLGSANHDSAVYPDHPDQLDITRANILPQSFGGGIHHCLGAQLARIEAEVALSTLLRRLPGLRLDDAENPAWRPTFVLRGLKRLPARWQCSRRPGRR